MGFDKKYISEESIRLIASYNDVEKFYNYFRSDAIITMDKFSSRILNRIIKCSINDKNKISNILKKCK